MSRITLYYKLQEDPNELFAKLYRHLILDGYQYVEFRGENIFIKGGSLSAQRCFKFAYCEDSFLMETWMLEGGKTNSQEFDNTRLHNPAEIKQWNLKIAALETIILGSAPAESDCLKSNEQLVSEMSGPLKKYARLWIVFLGCYFVCILTMVLLKVLDIKFSSNIIAFLIVMAMNALLVLSVVFFAKWHKKRRIMNSLQL